MLVVPPSDTDILRRIVDACPDGLLMLQDERIVFANAAAVRLLASPDASRVLGRRLADVLPAGHHAALEVVTVPLSGGAAQVTLRDVAERNAREGLLRESEERLRLAFAGAQEGVWDWNFETGAVVYSPRWKQMLGYDETEIAGNVSAWEQLLHPEDRPRALALTETVARGEDSYEGEFRLRHKDGHYVTVLTRGLPIRNAHGRVVRIVGTHLDMTERKRTEQALRESEERLALAFAGAQEGIWDWNLVTNHVVYSSRWKQMLGYEDHEIEPHISAWERLVHPDDRASADRAHESVARGGGMYEAEFRLRHKDGHFVHVLSRGFPVRRDPGGPVVRIVGTHFDLTERRKREAERARNELLSHLVFVQEDERRRIARDMHDQFGEHLTALSLRIALVKESYAKGVNVLEHTEALEAIARRLDHDIDQMVWQLRPTALDDLGLRAALTNYVQEWSERVNIAAALHTSGLLDSRLLPEVETALYRIAQEALNNVAKHARATSVEIILERRADCVLLIVEDDGVGFQPKADGEPGEGFGLVGMKERAALVGASLDIESTPGAGTTILVRMAVRAGEGAVAQHG